jgi:hypothetical protein
MRFAALSLVVIVAAGCASQDEVQEREMKKQYVVKYYDRNGDGVVDLEFHDIPGSMDAAWAFVDTKFRGRYDLKIQWSVGVTRDVVITPGQPPVRPSDLHFKRSNRALQSAAPLR